MIISINFNTKNLRLFSKGSTFIRGPSVLQTGEAKLIVVLDPCFLTGGSVVLNLPVIDGIELIAANIQGNQTTQSVIIPLQKVTFPTTGQTLYNVDLKI